MDYSFQITENGYTVWITKESFDQLNEAEQKRIERIRKDPWKELLEIGMESKDEEDPVLSFLRECASSFVDDLLRTAGLEEQRENAECQPDEERMEQIKASVPFVKEAGLVADAWIKNLYASLLDVFHQEIKDYPGSVKKYFNEKNPALNPAEKVFFHLVEHREGDYPFAFLATYAQKMEDGSIRHFPLHHALEQYQGDTPKILELLSCLNQAAKACPLIGSLMISGELFHPVGLEASEAYEYLCSVDELGKLGIVCRIPNWWKKRSSSIHLNVSIGEKKESLLGLKSLLSLRPSLSVDGKKLTKAEINQILNSSDGLVLIKGRWVEADKERLRAMLDQLDHLPEDITLGQALRIQAGLENENTLGLDESIGTITNGKWLASLRSKLSDPSILRNTAMPKGFQAKLRPYQTDGYNWLNTLSSMQFGALLADDMGLGKTVQTLAWLDKEHQSNPDAKALLIVPASLSGNWKKEAAQFAPDLDLQILHGQTAKKLNEQLEEQIKENKLPFLTITTYNMASRLEALKETHWDFLILDEAQAIKNPTTKQSTTIKKIPAEMRLAMTGTPIENDLINLWSIFDFLNAGLLGSLSQFRKFAKDLNEDTRESARLQKMISPFMLRRLKTDKNVISDLPEKVETNEYAKLSAKQKVLYNQALEDLKMALAKDGSDDDNGIARKGLVLASLTKFKQICNHPVQYLGQTDFDPKDSGKFELLRQICEPIAENHECVLVFTQFRQMTNVLDDYLASIFNARGFVINGQTPAQKRQEIVDAFQKQETYIPYVVLSLRAAGTGLTLTQASHVIHFDRWWNPAVENQATDRAFRIGQTKNVMVHKFVSEDTIEEKIDEMITNKQALADSIITDSTESWLTSLSDDELLSIMRMKL